LAGWRPVLAGIAGERRDDVAAVAGVALTVEDAVGIDHDGDVAVAVLVADADVVRGRCGIGRVGQRRHAERADANRERARAEKRSKPHETDSLWS
jgi:hypothetical protein